MSGQAKFQSQVAAIAVGADDINIIIEYPTGEDHPLSIGSPRRLEITGTGSIDHLV